MTRFRISIEEARKAIPGPNGERYAVLLERGQLEVELYQPQNIDPQQPHRRDEVYIVVAGSGTYALGRAATAYFVEGVSLMEARRTYLKSRKKRRGWELEEAQ